MPDEMVQQMEKDIEAAISNGEYSGRLLAN